MAEGANPAVVSALKQRLEVVQSLALVNARHLLNQQALGGAEFEILGIERDIAEEGPSQMRSEDLAQALGRRRQARGAIAECEERLAALELQLEDLDRRIAAG